MLTAGSKVGGVRGRERGEGNAKGEGDSYAPLLWLLFVMAGAL